MPSRAGTVPIVDLGRLSYGEAFDAQRSHLEQVLVARSEQRPEIGRVLMVEHDPVITISGRAGAAEHLLAGPEVLGRLGVRVEPTDRGGDITYHGPGQLVVYPILDLNRLNLGLHAYMRWLEQVTIETCARWGIEGERDPQATGVWVKSGGATCKVAAMGVRVRHWVSMHGLALNVDPDLGHFELIVPCGLAGRPVTSMARLLRAAGRPVPSLTEVGAAMSEIMTERLLALADAADAARLTGTRPRSDRGSS